jgi:hypothetical protein
MVSFRFGYLGANRDANAVTLLGFRLTTSGGVGCRKERGYFLQARVRVFTRGASNIEITSFTSWSQAGF